MWKAEASAGISRAGRFNQNIDQGEFSAANAQRTNVTIAFDDINYLRPGLSDHYHLLALPALTPGAHRATAFVRELATGREFTHALNFISE